MISNHDLLSLMTIEQREEAAKDIREMYRKIQLCNDGKCGGCEMCEVVEYGITEDTEGFALSSEEQDRLADYQHDIYRERRLLYPEEPEEPERD